MHKDTRISKLEGSLEEILKRYPYEITRSQKKENEENYFILRRKKEGSYILFIKYNPNKKGYNFNLTLSSITFREYDHLHKEIVNKIIKEFGEKTEMILEEP
jgi:hypothetical protein